MSEKLGGPGFGSSLVPRGAEVCSIRVPELPHLEVHAKGSITVAPPPPLVLGSGHCLLGEAT